MSKSKKWIVAALSLCFLLATAGLGMTAVKAAVADGDVFDYDWVAGNTLVGDVSLNDVKTAYEAEADRLTAAGWDFSKISIQHPLANPWPGIGDFKGQGFLIAHLTNSPSTGSQWGSNGYAFLVFNPHDKTVYTVKDEFFAKFTSGLEIFALGYPLDNDFTTDTGVRVQNFSYGYLKVEGGTAVFVDGKHIDQAGTETAITEDAFIENAVYPVYNPAPGATMANYVTSFKAALAGKTYDFPFTHKPQLEWENMWMMRVTGELSNANLWGEANNALLMYTASQNKMVLLVDEIAAKYTGDGTIPGRWGQAKAEQFAVEDVIYQNFDNGYVKVENGAVSFKGGMSVDADGNETQSFTAADTGKLADGVELAEGVTADVVKAAFTDKYEKSMGLPASYVTYFPSTKVLYQKYMDENGAVSEIYFRAADKVYAVEKTMYAAYSKPQDFSANWPGSALLGLPIGDAFVYDGATYQNFDKGYVRLVGTSGKPVVGAHMGADGARTILDFSGSIFVSPDIKIPASYGVSGEELLSLFKAEYKRLIEAGFAMGTPSTEGIKSWTEYAQDANNEFADNRGMIVLALQSGDSTSRPIYDVTMYMVYNPEGKNIQLIKDNVMTGIEQFRSQLGAPVGEAFAAKGNITVQNFQMGYVYATANGSAAYKDNLHYDRETGKEVNLDGSPLEPDDGGDDQPTTSPDIVDRGKTDRLLPLWITLGVVGGLAVIGVVIFILYKKGVLFKK